MAASKVLYLRCVLLFVIVTYAKCTSFIRIRSFFLDFFFYYKLTFYEPINIYYVLKGNVDGLVKSQLMMAKKKVQDQGAANPEE